MRNTDTEVPEEQKVYKPQQVHWHTPSEHTIDGAYADAEIHLVSSQESSDGKVEYAVVGLMFNTGDEENAFVKSFIDAFESRDLPDPDTVDQDEDDD